jgi:hypothetical protein
MGTGAFTAAEAERTVSVNVATDPNAYLGLDATDERASNSGSSNQLQLDFTGSDSGGSGLNPNATTTFDDLFTISNQGGNKFRVEIILSNDTVDPDVGTHLGDETGIESVLAYKEPPNEGTTGGGSGLGINTMGIENGTPVIKKDAANPARKTLQPGDSFSVGIQIETGETSPSTDSKITIIAAEPGSTRDNRN